MEHVFSLGLENPGGTKSDSEHLQATDSASGTPAECGPIFEVLPLESVTDLPSVHLGAGQKHEVPKAPAVDVSSAGLGNIVATGRTEDEDVQPETGYEESGQVVEPSELKEESAHCHIPLDMFEKLGFGHRPPLEPSNTPSHAIEESMLHKLHAPSQQVAANHMLPEHNLAERIEATIHDDTTHSPPHSEGSVQSTLGGGSAGEESEEFEKAIDFVQQHILRSHEPILEQMNDEQMAKTIKAQYKHLTGRGFPLKKH